MQPTICSRCQKHVAVVFITKVENGTAKNEGLCLKCAKELGGSIVLKDAVRFEKGEGIEKKQDNFAEEIASMVAGK